MRVRRLEIERFRGVRSLDWLRLGDTAALVGPGDSCKSTVLDALERVLSPRWNVPFDDTDFFGLDTTEPIRIRATLVDPPAGLLRDSKYGLALQAFDAESGKASAPLGADGEIYALVIELSVDRSLEPQWNVIDATGGQHPIQARDRELLGMLRVGGNIDVHLGWRRGSVLARLTESGESVAAVVADATRNARAGLAIDQLQTLKSAAGKAAFLGRELGATVSFGLVPHLDAGLLAANTGSLALHDGDVPLRRAGLGTRRLVTVAMQREAAGSAGLTLIDEFEHGLEPHRIRQLLRKLRGVAPEPADTTSGQLVLTTHSPTVLSELRPEEVAIVRRDGAGAVTVTQVPEILGRVLPKTPEALLARRVIVAEGATEVGLLETVEAMWSDEGVNFAHLGVSVVDGQGEHAPTIAGWLSDLGHTVALFVDADTAKPRLSRAKSAQVISWPTPLATENVLARDFSDDAFAALVRLADCSTKVSRPAWRTIRDAMAHALRKKPAEIGDELEAWKENVPNLREVFGAVAKKNGWFKTEELGRELGRLVVSDWNHLAGTDTCQTLEKLRGFAEHG